MARGERLWWRRGTVPGMSLAADERQAICDLLEELGPDQPTLCGDWTTRDLLAHLLVRERRPDAALGIVVPAAEQHTAKVQAETARRDFSELIQEFRSGPPIWTVFAIPKLGDRINLFEFYVHNEDIRRAQPEWRPRDLDEDREDALWGGLTSMGKMLFRRSPVDVVLRSAGRDDHTARKSDKSAGRVVHLVGLPSEIALIGFGRATELTHVVIQGEPDDVAAFEASPRGI